MRGNVKEKMIPSWPKSQCRCPPCPNPNPTTRAIPILLPIPLPFPTPNAAPTTDPTAAPTAAPDLHGQPKAPPDAHEEFDHRVCGREGAPVFGEGAEEECRIDATRERIWNLRRGVRREWGV